MSDERQWLAEFCRNGSELVFRQLVGRHLGLVYSTAMRMVNGDSHCAQDITQLVFSNLACKARSLPANVVLAGWLHSDTRFTALEWLRKEHRRAEREKEAAAMLELESAGDVEWSRLRPIIDEVLEELKRMTVTPCCCAFLNSKASRKWAAHWGWPKTQPASGSRVLSNNYAVRWPGAASIPPVRSWPDQLPRAPWLSRLSALLPP